MKTQRIREEKEWRAAALGWPRPSKLAEAKSHSAACGIGAGRTAALTCRA